MEVTDLMAMRQFNVDWYNMGWFILNQTRDAFRSEN